MDRVNRFPARQNPLRARRARWRFLTFRPTTSQSSAAAHHADGPLKPKRAAADGRAGAWSAGYGAGV